MEKIMELHTNQLLRRNKYPAISPNSSSTLLNAVWFYFVYYWCRRGREGQLELTRRSFAFATDISVAEYAYSSHDGASKTTKGENRKRSQERQTRLYGTRDEHDALKDVLKDVLEAVHRKTKPSMRSTISKGHEGNTAWRIQSDLLG